MTEVLVTGGAGFIGSHVVDRLVADGYDVTVVDNLTDQVHDGEPDYLNESATYVFEDIRNRAVLVDLLERADVVSHQASAVGVGQSMVEIERYVDVNTLATARLLDVVVEEAVDLDRLVVASSMSIYGEGTYHCPEGDGVVYPSRRGTEKLSRGQWEHGCPECGSPLEPVPTPETKPLDTSSVYGITKKDQEELCLTVGDAYDIPTVALRYFNVYGPRQSLDNPYTGVCAIFSSRIKNDNPPLVFEDGQQTRDFVNVRDVAEANVAAIQSDDAVGESINVGSGTPRSILEIAETLIHLYGKEDDLDPRITGEFREGDIRHCGADVEKARRLLGFEPRVDFETGMHELVSWGRERSASDRFDQAYNELSRAGLIERD